MTQGFFNCLKNNQRQFEYTCNCIIYNLSSDTSRFGYQMLTKMGWQSGKGLGAKEDGSTTHVKSVKRRDNLGKYELIERQTTLSIWPNIPI